MAKGLKAVRRVNLPSAVTADQGAVQGNQVEWALDLSSREMLAKTKAVLAASDGVLVAHFDPGTIDFAVSAPAAASNPAEAGGGDAAVDAPVDTSGMNVRVNSVGWTRYAALHDEAYVQEPSVAIELELTWPEDSRPLAYYPGKLTALTDDQGANLVPEEDDNGFGQSRQDVWEHSDSETLRLDAIGPDRDATALVGLTGSVRVVTQVNLNTVSLDNPATLVGQASVGDASLDELGFKIKKIDGTDLSISFKEGVEATDTIQKLTATLPDGTVVESNGWGGWSNEMTYNFPQDISAMKNLTLEILAGETVVAVPFAIERIELP